MAPKRKACPFIASGISRMESGVYAQWVAGPHIGTVEDCNKVKNVCLGCTLEQCVESRGRK